MKQVNYWGQLVETDRRVNYWNQVVLPTFPDAFTNQTLPATKREDNDDLLPL